MRRAPLLTVLACLCRAQSPQEVALASQRESILRQQEAVLRQGLTTGTPGQQRNSTADFRNRLLETTTPHSQQLHSALTIQKSSVARQMAAAKAAPVWQPPQPSHWAASLRPTLPPEPRPPETAPGSWAGAIELQVYSTARQPRPVWPEPSALARLPDCPPLPPPVLAPVLERAASTYGLVPSLLRAVVAQESSFRPCAVSPAGALGLMQLMPETAAFLGVTDPFDVEQNIFGGARFLRLLLDRFHNDLPLALSAYNAGPARVEAYGTIPPITETLGYVTGILRRLQMEPPGDDR
ncbi:MAG: lytic transglycosylase domain-containing protein [Bryobacteraceae bacterium]